MCKVVYTISRIIVNFRMLLCHRVYNLWEAKPQRFILYGRKIFMWCGGFWWNHHILSLITIAHETMTHFKPPNQPSIEISYFAKLKHCHIFQIYVEIHFYYCTVLYSPSRPWCWQLVHCLKLLYQHIFSLLLHVYILDHGDVIYGDWLRGSSIHH